jgi:hypothetical protein
MGWGDLAEGGLDIVEVAVNPHSMLLEPYVQLLAAQLKERISRSASTISALDTYEPELHEVEQCLGNSS